MKQRIAVLDCNNFFVSCERLFRPDLWQKPVVVLSSNDGCVVARSQEVKDIGVPMGVPYFKIKDIVKDNEITTFSSHFALYRDISRRVFTLLSESVEVLEQYSIDEAFMCVPDDCKPETFAADLKQLIEKRVGIPVSVGVGFSKTQAKVAVERAKKSRGVCVLAATDWEQLVSAIRLPEIWGVGANLERRYREHGLATVADLLAADPARIQKLFGIEGLRLQRELAGEAVQAVAHKPTRQHSIMSSRSFKDTTTDKQVVLDAVSYHVRHVAASLRAQDAGAVELAVSIRPSRHSDFLLRGGTARAILPAATNDTFELLEQATTLVEGLFETGVPYKKAGVVVSRLSPGPGQQSNLFTDRRSDLAGLHKVIDQLNHKSGRETVTIGNRLRHAAWITRVDARSPAYTTRWSDVAEVKA